MRILEHLEKREHEKLDFIHATKNKEIDTNTRAVVCSVCGEELVRTEKRIIDLEGLNDILRKYNISDIVAVKYTIGKSKILDVHLQFVEE